MIYSFVVVLLIFPPVPLKCSFICCGLIMSWSKNRFLLGEKGEGSNLSILLDGINTNTIGDAAAMKYNGWAGCHSHLPVRALQLFSICKYCSLDSNEPIQTNQRMHDASALHINLGRYWTRNQKAQILMKCRPWGTACKCSLPKRTVHKWLYQENSREKTDSGK